MHPPGKLEAESDKQTAKAVGITYAASRKHSVYAGHFPNYLPTVAYQNEGNKLLALINLEDLIDVFQEETEVELKSITDEMVPKFLEESLGKQGHWFAGQCCAVYG